MDLFLYSAVTPQIIESIYIRMIASGEQVVTCDVKGNPLPNVTWIMPENINAKLVSFQRGIIRASSSVPAFLLNTNYTCQIDGGNGLQNKSIYHANGSMVQECQISLSFFVIVVSFLTGISISILVIVVICFKKGTFF